MVVEGDVVQNALRIEHAVGFCEDGGELVGGDWDLAAEHVAEACKSVSKLVRSVDSWEVRCTLFAKRGLWEGIVGSSVAPGEDWGVLRGASGHLGGFQA